MNVDNSRYPTREEIDALVREARRDRAEAIARLFHDATSGLAELIAGRLVMDSEADAHRRASRSGISSAKEPPMTDSFWRTAAASLPPHLQWRYARLFEAAEEFERLLDFVLAARGRVDRVLARVCWGLADALRTAARALDVAARRLTPTR